MFVSENIKLQNELQDVQNLQIGIVHTQWNRRLVDMMYYDAVKTFINNGILEKHILSVEVPGSVEITFAAKKLAEKKTLSGILTLGCIIKGDTPHFDYVAMSVTQGITQLNILYPIPFVLGVLTTHNYQQALERANTKGREFSLTLLNMIALSQRI
ncbi:MAG: 6,7-dimethyl-8-ribityllumazine synthase [Bacteroidia bacterium]|nr:MAG: 6,7-dimethyl-8-ribityllumazine synthase [Bacteroidia bacterium]